MEKEIYFLIDVNKFENGDLLHFVLDFGSKESMNGHLDSNILMNKERSYSDFKIIKLTELLKMVYLKGGENCEMMKRLQNKI